MKTLPVVCEQAMQVDVAASLAEEESRQGDPGSRGSLLPRTYRQHGARG